MDDEEAEAKLGKDRYRVLRRGATEPAFSGSLLNNKKSGFYNCAYCGQDLFSSKHKYDSGSGWPSFDRAVADDKVRLAEDVSHGMVRIEAKCANCGSHLGHVFEDGPQETTGQRFCINSLALDFKENRS